MEYSKVGITKSHGSMLSVLCTATWCFKPLGIDWPKLAQKELCYHDKKVGGVKAMAHPSQEHNEVKSHRWNPRFRHVHPFCTEKSLLCHYYAAIFRCRLASLSVRHYHVASSCSNKTWQLHSCRKCPQNAAEGCFFMRSVRASMLKKRVRNVLERRRLRTLPADFLADGPHITKPLGCLHRRTSHCIQCNLHVWVPMFLLPQQN